MIKLIGVQGARLLRDRWAGETLKCETLGMWLTACPAESEAPGAEINSSKKQLRINLKTIQIIKKP